MDSIIDETTDNSCIERKYQYSVCLVLSMIIN